MIHALPGMGADRRMYPKAWQVLPDFIAHDWISHAGEQTIAEVARSMAEACRIHDGYVLIGSSMGGIVACEITKIRKISRLYLVGSALSKNEVNGLLALLHPLAKFAPIEWMRIFIRQYSRRTDADVCWSGCFVYPCYVWCNL